MLGRATVPLWSVPPAAVETGVTGRSRLGQATHGGVVTSTAHGQLDARPGVYSQQNWGWFWSGTGGAIACYGQTISELSLLPEMPGWGCQTAFFSTAELCSWWGDLDRRWQRKHFEIYAAVEEVEKCLRRCCIRFYDQKVTQFCQGRINGIKVVYSILLIILIVVVGIVRWHVRFLYGILTW